MCPLHQVDVMRCKNEGPDYDDSNIQWVCSASLPEEFKLGSTDVTCEGYESSEDPYVLKGSCGVEYRLLLTEKGEEKYGMTNHVDFWTSFVRSGFQKLIKFMFWLLLVVMIVVMVLSAIPCLGQGGRGGGTGPDDYPPYPPPRYSLSPKSSTGFSYPAYAQREQSRPWRPGFWTGAGAGAAAGYALGYRNADHTGRGLFRDRAGEGSSRSSSGSSYSSSRHESTGFGSTTRR